jgi:hypothetical protein
LRHLLTSNLLLLCALPLGNLRRLSFSLLLRLALLLGGSLLCHLLLTRLGLNKCLLLGLGLALLLGHASLRSRSLTGKAIGLCLAGSRFRSSLLLGLLLLFARSSLSCT